jgi:hypothetical protein
VMVAGEAQPTSPDVIHRQPDSHTGTPRPFLRSGRSPHGALSPLLFGDGRCPSANQAPSERPSMGRSRSHAVPSVRCPLHRRLTDPSLRGERTVFRAMGFIATVGRWTTSLSCIRLRALNPCPSPYGVRWSESNCDANVSIAASASPMSLPALASPRSICPNSNADLRIHRLRCWRRCLARWASPCSTSAGVPAFDSGRHLGSGRAGRFA